MKKPIIIIIFAIYIASIAVVNFFGLQIALYDGITYVDQIEITSLTVINDGDSYEITPYKTVADDYGETVAYYRFKFKTYTGEQNPNMIKIDYVLKPGNADNKSVDFVYAAKDDVFTFYKEKQTIEFLKSNRSVEITVCSTDGHNVKQRIEILCYA